MKYNWSIIGCYCIFVSCMLLEGCSSHSVSKEGTVPAPAAVKTISKPGSSFQDTLIIKEVTAVFFRPDTAQLLRLKAITDSMAFDGSMHEYFYQQRNARMVITKTWPAIKIVEADHYRFLLFIKKDNTQDLLDLDKIPDPLGLLVFNRLKAPLLIDMMNLETGISFYLK